jgi:ArsR family transcriptional regulator, lead/cadmium/zinc/bismuth-responsive transcriptional repressor
MTQRSEIIKCDCNVIHQEVVDQVKLTMPNTESIQNLSQLFKVLGDPTRIKIISALFKSEMCVCDMATLFNMTQSSISHQLSVLKQARLVNYRREGKVVYYALDDHHIQQIFDHGYSHIQER